MAEPYIVGDIITSTNEGHLGDAGRKSGHTISSYKWLNFSSQRHQAKLLRLSFLFSYDCMCHLSLYLPVCEMGMLIEVSCKAAARNIF